MKSHTGNEVTYAISVGVGQFHFTPSSAHHVSLGKYFDLGIVIGHSDEAKAFRPLGVVVPLYLHHTYIPR